MQPRVVLLGRIPERLGFYKLHRAPQAQPVDGMTICFVQSSVLFFNAGDVKDSLTEIIRAHPDTRWLVIEASAITQIDSTAAEMLLAVRSDLQARGTCVVFAEMQTDVAALLARAGLSADATTLFFDDLEDAYEAFGKVSRGPAPNPPDGTTDVRGTTQEEETR